MQITLNRKIKTANTTISELLVDDVFECFVLEDRDRGLKSGMTITEIRKTKVKGATAIPTGVYEVIISFSNKFQKFLPLLLDVKGYEGIRIHPGNTAKDTLGCLLPGTAKEKDKVLNSRIAFEALFTKLKAATKIEKIFITIK
jgi:hypothetical protein